jgi:hypothetical protein
MLLQKPKQAFLVTQFEWCLEKESLLYTLAENLDFGVASQGLSCKPLKRILFNEQIIQFISILPV